MSLSPVKLWAGITGLPQLIRYLAFHAFVGALIGIGLAAALLVADVAGIGTAFARADIRFIAGFVYFGSFALTVSACVTGTSVMFISWEDD